MFDLINIFDTFLPQLLLYPNPSDPLNPEAAAMMLKYTSKYEIKVKDHVKKYASGLIKEEKIEKPQSLETIDTPETKESYSDVGEESEEGLDFSDISELSDTSNIDLSD